MLNKFKWLDVAVGIYVLLVDAIASLVYIVSHLSFRYVPA